MVTGDHSGDESRWKDNIKMGLPIKEQCHMRISTGVSCLFLMNTEIALLFAGMARKFSST